MKEIEVWEYVLKWGLAQNSTLTQNPDTWSDDDFKTMKNTLQHCLPLIRFFCLSSKEIMQKVRPYQKLLSKQLYEDLICSYMDPDIVSTDSILLPRKIKNNKIIDSKIVDFDIFLTILRWIDNNDSKFAHVREYYLPREFNLLLRGSKDGFTPRKFHELCNGKYNTITFIKIKGTDEIIGGYNPLKWESSADTWGITNGSFIFSFINKNIKDAIISNVINLNHAIYFNTNCGPYFGDDIVFYNSKDQFTDYDKIRCKKCCYEKKIRDSEDYFSIEDYEVFQIIKR
uniref:TLDc domain-containing protein n=1 Tax=Rhizophagus irregularis (strain DAOM 181602 / DAOM 197198 / MUCL 43194) TaxID=747089 RepID=U9TWA9_RHIID